MKLKYYIHFFIAILLIVVGYLVFKDFIAIGFTNSDDSSNYVSTLIGGVFTDARIWAEAQGRFYFFYRVPWARIPYLIDNIYWIKTVQYLPVILGFILVSLIFGIFFRSFYFGCLLLNVLLVFFAIPGATYQPPTAYPFLFTTDVVLFLISFYLYQCYLRKHKYWYYVAFLFFFSIPFFSYESYIVIYFAVIFYTLYHGRARQKSTKNIHLFYNKEFLPLIGLGLLFLFLYFGYRFSIDYHFSGASYGGNTLASKINVYNVLKLIHNFNSSAFPLHIYFKYQSVFKSIDPTFQNSLFYILSELSFLELFKPILLSAIFYFLFSKVQIHLLTIKRAFVLFFGSISLCYIQNILFGLTQKYNHDVFTLDGYVTTYISFFGISLAILILLILPATKIVSSHFKKLYFVFVSILIFFISSLTSYSNKMLSHDLQISNRKFRLVDALVKDKEILNIGSKSTIKLEQLNETASLIGSSVCYGHFSWIWYILGRSNKKLAQLSDNKKLEELYFEKSNNSISLLKQLMNKRKEVVTLIFAQLNPKHLKNYKMFTNNLLVYLCLPEDNQQEYRLRINGKVHTLITNNSTSYLKLQKVHIMQNIAPNIFKVSIKCSTTDLETVVSE